MTFEQIWELLLVVPPVLWMLFNAHRSRSANRFVINIFGILFLTTCCTPGFAAQESSGAAQALAQNSLTVSHP